MGNGLFAGVPVLRSVVAKNVLLFLAILVVAVVPLAWQYDRDSRSYELDKLAAQLEFFAQRGAAWIDVPSLATLTRPEDKATPAYRRLLAVLKRIKREFDVDNAVVLRRGGDGRYQYVAIDHDSFDIGAPATIHDLFPAAFKASDDTWRAGEMMHSQLFGGRVEGTDYAQFVQINTPLKHDGQVVALLMLNKFAEPVAAAVRAKTMRVMMLTGALFAAGLALFAVISSRMLRPLTLLTVAAGEVARGNLDVMLPPARSRDEVGRLTTTFAGMIDGLRQRDFIRDTFGRYVSPEVVEKILGSEDGLKLGGERREITLLVSDLRGFTSLAGRLPPEEVIRLLNRYLQRVVGILTRHRATVDEFQGDGILAFFGAPLAAHDDAVRAVACAIDMQRALVGLNEEQRALGLPELEMGIAINTGDVIVGNIGSEQRTKYGAVGAPINLAYRIESQTVGGQVLISASTYERVRHVVRVGKTIEARLKGVDGPLTLYDVVAIDGALPATMPARADAPLRPLDPPMPCTCYPVEGTRVSEVPIAASLISVSSGAAEARLASKIDPRTVARIVLEPESGAVFSDIYAKVEEVFDEGGGVRARLVFTSLPPDSKRALDARSRTPGPRT